MQVWKNKCKYYIKKLGYILEQEISCHSIWIDHKKQNIKSYKRKKLDTITKLTK